ncbi:MAG: ROK family transcriptional regulator [Actinomycetota bacterium]|nr:ROK family transcriptional regulator [Actinomycetota bacterium]
MSRTGSLRVRTKSLHGDTREQNRRFALQQVFTDEPTTRADIARATGLTRATVGALVGELIEAGVVAEIGTAPSRGGKPPTMLKIDAGSRRIITINLSEGRWTASDEDLRGKIAQTSAVEAHDRRGAPDIDALSRFAASMVEMSDRQILGIGVATPGVVTHDGIVVAAANLDWHGLDVGGIIRERIGVPVHVINDSRAMALAEYAFGDHGTDNLFVINLGPGVGAGIILDGRLHGGEGDAAGEIGHVARRTTDGTLRTLEEDIGLDAVMGYLREALNSEATSSDSIVEQATAAFASSDERVVEVVARIGTRLGAVLAEATGILDIHDVVLTGPTCSLVPGLAEAAKAEHDRRVLPAVAARVRVRRSTVERAAQRGAAMYVIQREMGIL